jgi:hypothetical protein
MVGEDVTVELGPLEKVLLLVVVCDESDFLL